MDASMKLTLIFCVFLFAAGSHAAIYNVLDLYPEFEQLQDRVNSNRYQSIHNNAAVINYRKRQKADVHAQVEFTGTKNITSSQKIIFDSPIENIGGAYSTETGIFTAPFPGIYMFSVTLCQLTGNNWIYFNIIKDGTRLTTGLVGDLLWGSCGSAAAVTYMTEDSQVWVSPEENYYGNPKREWRHTLTASLVQ